MLLLSALLYRLMRISFHSQGKIEKERDYLRLAPPVSLLEAASRRSREEISESSQPMLLQDQCWFYQPDQSRLYPYLMGKGRN
jgi:hypothetical protein